LVIHSPLDLTQGSAVHYRRELSSDPDLVAFTPVAARRWPFTMWIHNIMKALSAEPDAGSFALEEFTQLRMRRSWCSASFRGFYSKRWRTSQLRAHATAPQRAILR